MSSKKKKSNGIDWRATLINALVDLIIGTVLIIIGKLLE